MLPHAPLPAPPPLPISPDRWLCQMFTAQIAARGGIIRRQVRDVERLIGRDRFLREIERRGYQLAENGEYFIIFCNRHPVRLLRR